MSTGPVYHVVSHTHWDREWYRSFHRFRALLVTMVDDLLELLEADPRFVSFMLDGQMVVLQDYLAVRPDREETIRELVHDGRLVIGPWYVLPDEFLVSAEATVRNLIEGERTARRFGGGMKVGYIPDSFGHIAMMPSLLEGFGMDTAVLYRGFGGEPGQESSEYSWRAPDGKQCLLVHLHSNGYSAGYFHQDSREEALRRFQALRHELDARSATSQRLILNGGDHHWPDARLPDTLELLRKETGATILHSTLPAYVEALRTEASDLPSVSGELRFGYRYAFVVMGGVYSSRMYLKQANWHNQNLLQRYAEPFHAWAVCAGMRSRLPLLHEAWRLLMQNHPHDSICGCSIDSVHREMMARFQGVTDAGEAVLDESLEWILREDDRATRDDRYLFFFNPSAQPRTEVAAGEVAFYRQDIVVGLNPDVAVDPALPPVNGFALLDEQGSEVPYQLCSRQGGYDIAYTRYNYPTQTYADRCSILVRAEDIPPLGFRGYRIERRGRFPRYDGAVRSGARFIENDALRVTVAANGTCTVLDRTSGYSWKGLHLFEDGGDVGDEYNYSYPRKDRRLTSRSATARIRVLEHGPLRATLRCEMRLSVPAEASADRTSRGSRMTSLRITTDLSLTENSRTLQFVTTVENTARDHRLRVLFPTSFRTRRALADSQFALVEREQQEIDPAEFTIEHPARVAPMQRFVSVRERGRACVLFSYGLPEYEYPADSRGALALTLLRCVGLLAGEDLITRPGGKAGWHNETPEAQCQGSHTFRYGFLPLSEQELEEGSLVTEEADRFHLPLYPLRRKTEAALPFSSWMLALEPGSLTLSAVKVAEDAKGIVLRVYNTTRSARMATLRSARPVLHAWHARLDETVLGEIPVQEGNRVEFNVGAAEVVTLRLECDHDRRPS